MRILLIGSEGSMGKRYQAILKYLGIEFDCEDISRPANNMPYPQYDGFIVATPTDTHYNILKALKDSKKPILCEKPITKDLGELKEILSWDMDLTMMFQYSKILKDMIVYNWGTCSGYSFYDYFRTGNDGLFWDCMQIIALHKGSKEKLHIDNKSYVWKCEINNTALDIAKMDGAYRSYVESWLTGKKQTSEFILRAHEKVVEYKEWYDQSYHRNTSEKHLNQIPEKGL